MLDVLVIAGCLSGEKGDAGVSSLVDELAAAVAAVGVMVFSPSCAAVNQPSKR